MRQQEELQKYGRVVDRLEAKVEHLTLQLGDLLDSIRAAPYMVGEEFHCQNSKGKPMLAFAEKQAKSETLNKPEISFMNLFRGAESLIKERLKVYMPFVKGKNGWSI